MSDTNPTKAEIQEQKALLEQENTELKQQIADGVEERSNLLDALSSLSDRVDQLAGAAAAQRDAGNPYDPEPELAYDPYDEQNPHAILSHPEGWVLSWKNPDYRAHRGWRGWVPVEYDDEIGQNLTKYLNDPPARMEGMANVDNYVRRGTDSILCKLPKDIWDARQAKRSRDAEFRFQQSQAAKQQRTKHYQTYGEGAVPRSTGETPLRSSGDPAPMVQTDMFRRE